MKARHIKRTARKWVCGAACAACILVLVSEPSEGATMAQWLGTMAVAAGVVMIAGRALARIIEVEERAKHINAMKGGQRV